MGHFLRLIRLGVFLLALPFLLTIGLFVKARSRTEETEEDESIVAPEELEDAALETEEPDWIRRWLADSSPTRRAKLIRLGYSRQRFSPRLPWVRTRRG